MHKIILYAAFGWLAAAGALHFLIDVVSQYLRGIRPPGPETTLFYGLNTAFAFGQAMFGLLGLLVTWQSSSIFSTWQGVGLSLLAAVGWLAFSFKFLGYWEPKLVTFVFCALVVAAGFFA